MGNIINYTVLFTQMHLQKANTRKEGVGTVHR
jgi:hypothetical protein